MKGSKRRRTQRKEVEIVEKHKEDETSCQFLRHLTLVQEEFERVQSEGIAFRDQTRKASSLVVETGAELDRQKEVCGELQKQKEELQKQNEELQKQKEVLKVYIEGISAQKEVYKQQKDELKQQKDELKQQYDELKQQYEELAFQCDEYRKRNEVHRKRLDDLEVCSCCVCDKN